MKCWVHKEGENKHVTAMELKDYLADGWKKGKLLDMAEFLDKVQETREEIVKRKTDVNKKESQEET